jgi:DNA-binding PadR family transcriptional regulator
LLLLHRGEAHGYNLIQGLEEFGFDVNSLNPGLVYRALHEMEQGGYVVSEWEEEKSLGPPRRVYRLTSQGDEVLSQWVEELRESRKVLDGFIEAHETHLEKHLS